MGQKTKSTRPRKKSTVSPKRRILREPVKPEDVILVKGRGSADRGGGSGGYYWHIHVNGKRVGYIFINIISDAFLDEHASVQIHINQAERGKQIGRVAYGLACKESNYDQVYAHMRKTNIASKRAAEEAGFSIVKDERIPQLAMVWQKLSK